MIHTIAVVWYVQLNDGPHGAWAGAVVPPLGPGQRQGGYDKLS